MLSFPQRVRHAVRRLVSTPLITVVSLTTLALGIGANSAIFSIVNGVLLKPLPFHEPDRLVGIWHKAPGLGFSEVNQGPAFHLVYREENRVFEDIALWENAFSSITGLSEPHQVQALRVTDSFFPTLRVQPALGRAFNAADDLPGSPETVILSHAYWQNRFGGDPGVLGRKLVGDGRPREIIGVLPQSFRFLQATPQLFYPMQLDRAALFVGAFSYMSFARLKPGATVEQANADVARMIPDVLKKFPLPPGFTSSMLEEARLGPNVRSLKQDVVGDVGKVLWILLGTVGIVLLIACANVANLFLVRAEGRQRELAIRSAMGAGWGEIAQEVLFETVTLAVAGGALGLLLAQAGVKLLIARSPGSIPRLDEIVIDPVVLLFTVAVSISAGLLFGILPVFKYANPDIVSALKDGGRASGGKERHRARNLLVILQIALAMVLLVSSGLMIRTFQALRKVQPGFVRPEEVLTVRISIPRAEVAEPEKVIRSFEQVLHGIEAVPGVQSVGISNSVTMDRYQNNDPIFVEDFPAPDGQLPPIRRFKFVSPGYFGTMGNPILYGRDFTWTDVYQKRRVVLVSENLAREYWKDPARAVGRRIRETPKNPWREIIGVTGNEHDDGVHLSPPRIVHWPMMLDSFWGDEVHIRRSMCYAIRSRRAGDPSFLLDVQKAVWAASPNLPLANVSLLSTILSESMTRTSFTLTMLGISSFVALLLGLVGVYGIISYSVSQRTREIGIRVALGAPPAQVRGLFVRDGVRLICVGVALGFGAALALTRLMSALLFGISPADPATFGSVAAVLGIVTLLASYLPARRASSVDPIEALRQE